MATEKRLIDANALAERYDKRIEWLRLDVHDKYSLGLYHGASTDKDLIAEIPTVVAFTEEQLANILEAAGNLENRNQKLEKELEWLKSCINCEIRKECPRHCGKVVHGCDHWEYGDSTVDAVEVDDMKEFAEDVAYQFGYYCQNGGRLCITHGGLSTLEWAFNILGWENPHPVPECECEIEGCHEHATCGTPTADGYKRVCGRHLIRICAKMDGE